MTVKVPDQCAVIDLVIDGLVDLRITASARTAFLLKSIEINFVLVENRGCRTQYW